MRRGRLNVLELLVEHGAKLSYKDKAGRGALSHAISWQSADLLPFLLEQDLNINEQDMHGRTALMLSVIHGTEIIEPLLAKGAQLDIQDNWGKTALIHAASRGYTSTVATLLHAGADILTRDIRGREVLYWASLGSSLETFDRILDAMLEANPVPSHYQNAVSAAAISGNDTFAAQLLSHFQYSYLQVDEDGWSVLYTAEQYERWWITSIIDDAGLKLNRSSRMVEYDVPSPKCPTQWHAMDKSVGLKRPQTNPLVIKVDCELTDISC